MLTFPRNSPSPSHVSLCECCWNLVTSPQLTSDFSHSPYQGPFELTVPHIFPHLLMTFSQATYCINAAQMKSGHLYSDFHNGGGEQGDPVCCSLPSFRSMILQAFSKILRGLWMMLLCMGSSCLPVSLPSPPPLFFVTWDHLPKMACIQAPASGSPWEETQTKIQFTSLKWVRNTLPDTSCVTPGWIS